MARFRIVGSRSTGNPEIADCDVVYLDGNLVPGETFIVYDTHHPIECYVMDVFVRESISTLRCKLFLVLGWENQFSGAIVDTQATTGSTAFRYEKIID